MDPQKPGVAQTSRLERPAPMASFSIVPEIFSFRAVAAESSIGWARMEARRKPRFKLKSMPGHFRMGRANRRLLPMV